MSARETMVLTPREAAAVLMMAGRERAIEGDYGTGCIRVDGEHAWVKDEVEKMRKGATS